MHVTEKNRQHLEHAFASTTLFEGMLKSAHTALGALVRLEVNACTTLLSVEQQVKTRQLVHKKTRGHSQHGGTSCRSKKLNAPVKHSCCVRTTIMRC